MFSKKKKADCSIDDEASKTILVIFLEVLKKTFLKSFAFGLFLLFFFSWITSVTKIFNFIASIDNKERSRIVKNLVEFFKNFLIHNSYLQDFTLSLMPLFHFFFLMNSFTKKIVIDKKVVGCALLDEELSNILVALKQNSTLQKLSIGSFLSFVSQIHFLLIVSWIRGPKNGTIFLSIDWWHIED